MGAAMTNDERSSVADASAHESTIAQDNQSATRSGRLPAIGGGNLLIEALGKPKSLVELTSALSYWPPKIDVSGLADFERLHLVSTIRDLHLPSPGGISVARQIDLMLREGYRHRSPTGAKGWQSIYALSSPNLADQMKLAPAMIGSPLAAAAVGVSGVGKTASIERALSLYPQCVEHDSFPQMSREHKQLVWLKVEVPGSGKAIDLARALWLATDIALESDYSSEKSVADAKSGMVLLNLWLRRVACHYLGILALDEIQNLFKIGTLAQRKSSKTATQKPLLRIVDDEALKFILTLINVAKIPIMVSGTHDAMEIFETRLSTSQRLTIEGLIRFDHAHSSEQDYFRDILLPALFQYQFLDHKATCSPQWRLAIYRYTAGLPRLCVNLWIHSQRLALERGVKMVTIKHVDHVMATTMSPSMKGVDALLSRDPRRYAKYEDLRHDF
jgi:hypothetical protein